ncbi:MAG: glycolate oxidase subunit GlcE [Rhodoferax sp.]|nr:glycolate oxidase subunit GlcE [Rhodoferax sp.]MCF8208710.1 glycolate oxidase subunit GlcE [Rhodoferax sp.]
MDRAIALITERIRAAITDRTPLRMQGGGSKNFYGNSQQGDLLDTRGLSGIRSYEPSELVVTVGSGMPLAELELVLALQGQCLAFEPPHFAWNGARVATVGGMVACGLAGPARASVGGVRDYVLGLQMVNGKGESLTFGGQVMKNVAGYDVSRLMVGAMGTLGLLTEVSLKVLPVAPAEATLCFALGQAQALEALHVWGGQPLPLSASCWVRDAAKPGRAADLLFVRLRGAAAAVQAACKKMLADQPGYCMDNAQAQADWELCRNQQLPFFLQRPSDAMALWRISVAPTAPVLDLPWPQLVEWHGGQRWLWAPESAMPQLQTLAQSHGGHATLFVAAVNAAEPAQHRFATKSPTLAAIERRLKDNFDPHGIFNPGRLTTAA